MVNVVRAIVAGAMVALVLCAQCVMAQEDVLSEVYGNGVHEYFSGNYSRAYTDLSSAVNAGIQDPRAYYFRALTLIQLGRPHEAQADMHKGAALESADVNQFYPVSKSLERVQGSARLQLERSRAVARVEARQRQRRRDADRYEAQRRAESELLRQSITPPVGVPAPAEAPAPRPAEVPATPQPVAPSVPAAVPTSPNAAPPATPTAPEEGDPFAPAKSGAAVPAPPAADKAPAAPPAVEKPAAPSEKQAAPPAADNLFGDQPAKEEPAKAKDGGEKKPADKDAADDDPFGK